MQRNLIESTGSNIGRYTSALLSTLYMGAGQIANGQWLKGIFLILFETFVLIPSVPLLLKNLKGLITLGETPMVDHSLFMMIYGILAAVAAIFLIVCYLVNIRDAYEHGLAIDKGGKRKGWKETLSDMIDAGFPYLILAPGILCIILFTFLPMAFNIMIAFTDYDLFHSPPRHILNWVGFRNFVEFLTTASWANTFKQVMLWTVVWAVLSTLTTYLLGMIIALILNNPRIKFRKVIRTILILPYAIPAFISILMWKGMLNTNFGIVNHLLTTTFNMQPIPWLENVFWTRFAVIMVNLWLGFPYSMMMITGILQGLPNDFYEAATVDGASGFQKFRYITFPLVMFSVAPLVIMSFAYNFNNFNVIFLLNDGLPAVFGLQGKAGGSDILISWVYKLTFQSLKFNYAAAMSLIIFLLIVGFSIYNYTRTRSFKEEEMLR
jgi:arabinogalactan oligomer/maltooligosaccharide transport system permease protein